MGNDVCDLGYHFMLFIISSQVQNCRRYSLESQTSGDNQWCFFYRNENSWTVWSYFSFNFGQTFTFCYLRLIFLFNDAKVQNLLPLSKLSQMFKVWYFFARSEFWFITTTQKWLSAIILKVGRLSTEMKQKTNSVDEVHWRGLVAWLKSKWIVHCIASKCPLIPGLKHWLLNAATICDCILFETCKLSAFGEINFLVRMISWTG